MRPQLLILLAALAACRPDASDETPSFSESEDAIRGSQVELLTAYLQKQADVRDVQVVKHPYYPKGYVAIEFWLMQPVDHDDPSKGSFPQWAQIFHKDRSKPMVLATDGYGAEGSYWLEEPAWLLEGNQVRVEHRYFAGSRPLGPVDWNTMLIRQAANDHHRFAEMLRKFYLGAWVSTGASKGGMTATYHRRFFPDDVEATIAYVAPHSLSRSDDRFPPYLRAIQGPECNARITASERSMLLEFPRFRDHFVALGYPVDVASRAVVGAILSARWAFWQYGYHYPNMGDPWLCEEYVAADADIDTKLAFLNKWAGFSPDESPSPLYTPYYLQAEQELGYPGEDLSALEDLIPELEPSPTSYYPDNFQPVYRPEAMQDISRFIASECRGILYIYAESDPWSGGKFAPGAGTDCHVLTNAVGAHGTGIWAMNQEARATTDALLKRWLAARTATPNPITMRPTRERCEPLQADGRGTCATGFIDRTLRYKHRVR